MSDEEFLAAQRRAHVPEVCIKRLEEMAPKVLLASKPEGESFMGSSVGAVGTDDSVAT
jgi:hypothetical protein